MPVPHTHKEVEVNLVESGSMTYLSEGRLVKLPKGHMAVLWAAYPHQIVELEGNCRCSWMNVPLAMFLSWGLPQELVGPLMSGKIVSEPVTDVAFEAMRFAQWDRDLSAHSPDLNQCVALEVRSRLIRLAYAVGEKVGHLHNTNYLPGPLERIVMSITTKFREPLSVEDLCRDSGYHPNYAMTRFKEAFGVTILDFITQHRIAHAIRLLATTDWTLERIASDSGFGSVSRFYEAFRSSTGVPPGEFRRKLRPI